MSEQNTDPALLTKPHPNHIHYIQRARSMLKAAIFKKNGPGKTYLIFTLIWFSHSCSSCVIYFCLSFFFDWLPIFIFPVLSFAPPLFLKWYSPTSHKPSTHFLFISTSTQILFCIHPLSDLSL